MYNMEKYIGIEIIVFNNTYKQAPVTVDVKVFKELMEIKY